MSINPGLGGGAFISSRATQLRELMELLAKALFASAHASVALEHIETKMSLAALSHTLCSSLQNVARRLHELGADCDPAKVLLEAHGKLAWSQSGQAVLDHIAEDLVQIERTLGDIEQCGLEDLPSQRIAASASREIGADREALTAAARTGDASVFVPRDRSELVPGRDERFTVVETYVRPRARAGDSPESALKESLHTLIMGTEIPTIETCAICILDNPEMPLEFIGDMARQMWDESRHAGMFIERLHELGGKLGTYPIDLRLWRMVNTVALPMRLMIHQRLGEWLGVDAVCEGKRRSRISGDEETARIMDFVAADEITHVAIGNRWIRRLVPVEDIGQLHLEGETIRRAAGADVNGRRPYPVNEWACSRSGFTGEETSALVSQRTCIRESS